MDEREALFDKAAPLYDDQFTYSAIGSLQRKRVYYWMGKYGLLKKSNSVFEINCGTGYDAQFFYEKELQVTATDASSEMIAYARKNRSNSINFFTLKFKDLANSWIESNVLFSNFGGLNCVNHSELVEIANTASKNQKKGNYIVWVIMPKFCMMETLYLLSKFKFSSLFRRNTNKGVNINVDGTEVTTYYHSPKSVKKILASNYHIIAIKPVAYFLPPSYLESFFNKRKRLLNFLNKLDALFGNLSVLSSYSDHYILIAEKK